jgi:hypothetical protein
LLVEHPSLRVNNILKHSMYELAGNPTPNSIVENEQPDSAHLIAFLLISIWTSWNVNDDYYLWGDGAPVLLAFGHHRLKVTAADSGNLDRSMRILEVCRENWKASLEK